MYFLYRLSNLPSMSTCSDKSNIFIYFKSSVETYSSVDFGNTVDIPRSFGKATHYTHGHIHTTSRPLLRPCFGLGYCALEGLVACLPLQLPPADVWIFLLESWHLRQTSQLASWRSCFLSQLSVSRGYWGGLSMLESIVK